MDKPKKKKRFIKPKEKKFVIEYKPHRGTWKRAELLNSDKLDKVVLRLEDGNIVRRTSLRNFRWGPTKKKKRKKKYG